MSEQSLAASPYEGFDLLLGDAGAYAELDQPLELFGVELFHRALQQDP